MDSILAQLEQHLVDTLGVIVNPVPWIGGKRLPFFLRDRYRFFEVQLLDIPCLLMVDRRDQEQSPATVGKHMDRVQARWDGQIVYVRDRVTAYNRKRLVERKLPFVVPGNQVYLPMKGIDFREHFKRLRTGLRQFSPSTQALVMHVLYGKTTESVFSPAEMALSLGYSAMTMTRAFDELESAGLGEFYSLGRKRCLKFIEPARDIWTSSLPFLRSPVKRRVHVAPPSTDLPGPRAGLTALAHYSSLAAPGNVVVALNGADWRVFARCFPRNGLPMREPGALDIEVWSYDPAPLSREGVVDPLSLYLSLMPGGDERIEAALEEVLEGLEW